MELNDKEMQARKMVCLPLDNLATLDDLKARVDELAPVVGMFKIGKGSFTRFGPAAVQEVQARGAQVFLDLKYHDIPNTVNDAAYAAAQMGVYMFNVHSSGGIEMMRATYEGAVKGAQESGKAMPKVIGVTVLTSIDSQILSRELRVEGAVDNHVLHLAKLTRQAGLDGIVCSAGDLYNVKRRFNADFLYVTPGIEGTTTPAGPDQKRVFSPGNAVRAGSSMLVVGRAITARPTPQLRLEAGYEILKDIARVL